MAPVSATHNCSSQSSGLPNDTTFNPKGSFDEVQIPTKIDSLVQVHTSNFRVYYYDCKPLLRRSTNHSNSRCLPNPSNFSDHNTKKLRTAISYPRLCSLHPTPTKSSTFWNFGKSWQITMQREESETGEVRWGDQPTRAGLMGDR